MMIKVFARGGGGGSGVIDYMLGKDREREKARVLDGDAEKTLELIDGLDFSRNYTAGVLSFAEQADQLTNEQKNDIMKRFEECVFSGLDADQYNILWVEHSDKNGRLELNFVIPNVELQSGKRLQPYYDRTDRRRFNDFQTIVNHEYKLADPNDPSRKRTITTAKDLPRNKKEAVEAITHDLTKQIEAGAITSRDDVVNTLEAAGFTVARQTKSSISIADPDGGKNIRLKGAIYEQSFTASAELEQTIKRSAREYRERAEERYSEAQRSYTNRLARAREYNQSKYRRDRPRASENIERAARSANIAEQNKSQSDLHSRVNWLNNLLPDFRSELLLREQSGTILHGSRDVKEQWSDNNTMRKGWRASTLRPSDGRRGLEGRATQDTIHGNSEVKGNAEHRKNVIKRIRATTEASQRDYERANDKTRRTRKTTNDIERKHQHTKSINERFNRSIGQVKQKIESVVAKVEKAVKARKQAEYAGRSDPDKGGYSR